MSAGHAFCSPSGYERWSHCHGAPALEEAEPDNDNEYSADGIAKHEHAARLLRIPGGPSTEDIDSIPSPMRHDVMLYVNGVLERAAAHKLAGAAFVSTLVEVKLDISSITGEPKAQGTADCILLATFAGDPAMVVMDVIDAKFGRGVVVDVAHNGQLQIYALAALVQYAMVHPIREVNLIIHQPPVREAPQEWAVTLEDLYRFGPEVTEHAAAALALRGDVQALSHLNAGTWCKSTFCKAQWRCPELQKLAFREVYGEFQNLDDPKAVPIPLEDKTLTMTPERKGQMLARSMDRIAAIESWCLQVRAACDQAMLNEGIKVPGWKVVQGRQGNRAWTDTEMALALLQLQGVDAELVMTTPALKSPTEVEKALKDDYPEEWRSLQAQIKRAPGKASVAPVSDARPEFNPAATTADFDNLTGEELA